MCLSVRCHSQDICSEVVCIEASLAEFIFSNNPCFQHILLNTFRRMHLNYQNCFLRCILFQALKYYSDYKSLIAKTFDGNTLKMKAVSAIQVKNNKMHCFLFYLDWTCTQLGVLKEILHPCYVEKQMFEHILQRVWNVINLMKKAQNGVKSGKSQTNFQRHYFLRSFCLFLKFSKVSSVFLSLMFHNKANLEDKKSCFP